MVLDHSTSHGRDPRLTLRLAPPPESRGGGKEEEKGAGQEMA